MIPLQFIHSQYRWSNFREKVEPYLTDEKCDKKLKTYVLPRSMSDSEIQKETNSLPIPVSIIASVMQNFLKDADKSGYYIFHTQIRNESVAFDVCWGGGEWRFDAYEFVDGGGWRTWAALMGRS